MGCVHNQETEKLDLEEFEKWVLGHIPFVRTLEAWKRPLAKEYESKPV